MEHTRVVISDLHVGQNDEFDIFRSDEKPQLFANFIQYLRDKKTPIELVINGDFVDFLQLTPWNDLSRSAALIKIRQITKQSAYFFDELGTFLKDQENKLVILPGNHDVELAFPEVGQVLREAILKNAPDAADRIQMFDSDHDRRTTYRPTINGVLVQIEHGNEGDPWNSLSYQQLFADAETSSTDFDYPPGTKLVYESMNSFKEHFRFVDLLKPEMPAVLIILVALKPFMSAMKVPATAIKGLQSVGNAVKVAIRRGVNGPQLGSESEEIPPGDIDEKLKEFFTKVLPQDHPNDKEMDIFLNSDEIEGDVLGPRINKIKLWLVSWAVRGLALFQAKERGLEFYQADHPNSYSAKGAEKRLVGDVQLVIFGHTHEALKAEFKNGVYVNSGTWANLVGLPRDTGDELLEWLEKLRNNTFEKTAFLTFIELQPADTGIDVSLNSWSEKGAEQLWTKNISPSN